MPKSRGELRLLACDSGKHFAEKILKKLVEKEFTGIDELVDSEEVYFANTEIKTVINESIRNADIYIVQDVENKAESYSVNDNFMALASALGAAWESDARCITAVIPVFPYARQDDPNGREPRTAKIAAKVIDLYADHVITMDLHNTTIEGFFDKARVDNLHASRNVIKYINENKEYFDHDNIVVSAPDLGGAKRAEHYSLKMYIQQVFAHKTRDLDKANKVKKMDIVGDVNGKDVLIVDDMIDTGGTLEKALYKAKENGARRVYAACSLPLFNGKALDRINNAYEKGVLDMVISNETVYHGEDFIKENPWFKQAPVDSYFAKVIRRMNQRESISALLK